MDVPGTVQLVDAQGLFHGLHSHNHNQQERDIVLVPQPSDDPEDPLRWTAPRKTRNMLVALTWCFFVAAMISGLSPAYLLIEADTGISVADLSTGNGILFLFLGWGTMVTQCSALSFGRRPTLVVSILLTSAVTVWMAYVKSRGEFFTNRVFLGIVASPQETLIEVVVGDLFFAHDRGFYMGAYSWTLWCGAFLCPVASGYVAQELGWRWIQYILACIGAGVAVLTFFAFEETMFYRPGAHAIEGGLEGPQYHEKVTESVSDPVSDPEKAASDNSTHSVPEPTVPSTLPAAEQQQQQQQQQQHKTPQSYFQKLRLWGFRDPRQPHAFRVFFLPIRLLFMFPGIGFGGLLVGGILAWYNVVSGSLALILGDAPYNFSANSIGLCYLACVVGVTVGCFLSGWAADGLAVRLARRNPSGLMEPEQRLWTSVVALVLHPAGCLLYGVGASYHIHWFGVVFGLGLIGVTLPMGSNLAFTYILDSYKEVAGEGLVSAILIRNMMGFAFGYAVVPMINNLTLRYAFVLIALLGLAVWSTAIIMIYVGKRFRRATAGSYWKLVQHYGATAH